MIDTLAEWVDKQYWRKGVRLMLPVLAIFYLSFHAVSGERGIYAWFKARHELESLQAHLAEVKAQRAAYEDNIKGLRSQSLDLDLLDEQTRKVLGYVGQDEIILSDQETKN